MTFENPILIKNAYNVGKKISEAFHKSSEHISPRDIHSKSG